MAYEIIDWLTEMHPVPSGELSYRDDFFADLLNHPELGGDQLRRLGAWDAGGIAAGYCADAIRAAKAGDRDKAWFFVVQAAYSFGMWHHAYHNAKKPPSGSAIGRLGRMKTLVETEAMKEEVRQWCEVHRSQFGSLNKLRDAVIAARLNAAKPSTVRGWLTEWAKQWQSPGVRR